MRTRTGLLKAVGERYRLAKRGEKRGILDEFVAVTGYHRKHAIRMLRNERSDVQPHKRKQPRYGGGVREALIVLGESSDQVCSKRLKPLIPILLPALQPHGKLELDDTLRARLLAVSPATIDRLLSEVRIVAANGRRRCAGAASGILDQTCARRCAERQVGTEGWPLRSNQGMQLGEPTVLARSPCDDTRTLGNIPS